MPTVINGTTGIDKFQNGALSSDGTVVLTTGDFGIGALTPTTASDPNAVFGTGLYRINNGSSVGLPVDVASLINIRLNDSNAATQIATDYLSGKTWVRTQNTSAWGAWRLIYAQSTILGTVSQSGGVPTGAIIESGSNSNGDYIRYADGTQICITNTVLSSQTPTQIGTTGIYSFTIVSVAPYPAAFVSLPKVIVSGRTASGSLAFGSMGGTVLTTHWPPERRVLVVGNTTTSAELYSLAIGRWY